jgi:hypothetical protein
MDSHIIAEIANYVNIQAAEMGIQQGGYVKCCICQGLSKGGPCSKCLKDIHTKQAVQDRIFQEQQRKDAVLKALAEKQAKLKLKYAESKLAGAKLHQSFQSADYKNAAAIAAVEAQTQSILAACAAAPGPVPALPAPVPRSPQRPINVAVDLMDFEETPPVLVPPIPVYAGGATAVGPMPPPPSMSLPPFAVPVNAPVAQIRPSAALPTRSNVEERRQLLAQLAALRRQKAELDALVETEFKSGAFDDGILHWHSVDFVNSEIAQTEARIQTLASLASP